MWIAGIDGIRYLETFSSNDRGFVDVIFDDSRIHVFVYNKNNVSFLMVASERGIIKSWIVRLTLKSGSYR